jgi:hypothetical protein
MFLFELFRVTQGLKNFATVNASMPLVKVWQILAPTSDILFLFIYNRTVLFMFKKKIILNKNVLNQVKI